MVLNVVLALLFAAKSCEQTRLYASLTPDNTASLRGRTTQQEDVFAFPNSEEAGGVTYYNQQRSGFGGNYYFQYNEGFDQQRPDMAARLAPQRSSLPTYDHYNYSNNKTPVRLLHFLLFKNEKYDCHKQYSYQ